MNAQGAQRDCKHISTSLRTHRENRGIVLSLEMDQESSGIELVYVCVCEGGEGRLGCGFMLLYSILISWYNIIGFLLPCGCS